MTQLISAFIELPPGETPPWHSTSAWEEAEFEAKTSEGLEVFNWSGEYPENSQVYLVWEPRVYAVWDADEEEEKPNDE